MDFHSFQAKEGKECVQASALFLLIDEDNTSFPECFEAQDDQRGFSSNQKRVDSVAIEELAMHNLSIFLFSLGFCVLFLVFACSCDFFTIVSDKLVPVIKLLSFRRDFTSLNHFIATILIFFHVFFCFLHVGHLELAFLIVFVVALRCIFFAM